MKSPCDQGRRDTACGPNRLSDLRTDHTRVVTFWATTTLRIGAKTNTPDALVVWPQRPDRPDTDALSAHEEGHARPETSVESTPLLARRVQQGLKRAKIEDDLAKGVITAQQYSRLKSSLMYEEWDTLKAYASQSPGTSATRVSATSITFSPDGKFLASGGDDQTVRLWDVKTGEIVGTTPPSLYQWLKLADSRVALERQFLGNLLNAREYELGLAALGRLEDQIAVALPLSLSSVVFTVRLTTAAGLNVVRDYDGQFDPRDFIPHIVFYNERPNTSASATEGARGWFIATAGVLSALCAGFTVVLNRRKQKQDEAKEEQEKLERGLRIRKLEYDLLPDESPPAGPARAAAGGRHFINVIPDMALSESAARPRTVVLLSAAGVGETTTVVATFGVAAAAPPHLPAWAADANVIP